MKYKLVAVLIVSVLAGSAKATSLESWDLREYLQAAGFSVAGISCEGEGDKVLCVAHLKPVFTAPGAVSAARRREARSLSERLVGGKAEQSERDRLQAIMAAEIFKLDDSGANHDH